MRFKILSEMNDNFLHYKKFSFVLVDPFYRKTSISFPKNYVHISCASLI